MRDRNEIECELWCLRIPLARAIGSPGRRYDSTHLLFAILRDGAGNRGIGYSRFFDAADLDPSAREAHALLQQARTLSLLLDIERIEASFQAETTVASRSAANALSTAAWDLAGRQRGVACADLWGRGAGRDRIDCYASSLFLHTPVHELTAEARNYQARNYRVVKMRLAPTPEETEERIDAVRAVYAQPGTIAIEAAFSWPVGFANAFLRNATFDPAWVEDPVEYAMLRDLDRNGRRLAAGEVLATTQELVALYENDRISNVIIDVQAIGGPVRFLEAARILHALGARVGSHRFPHQSAHLLAALPQSMGVEAIDWSNPALKAMADPDASGTFPVHGPGFNAEIDAAVFAEYGERVV
jgi:L-alanine-DL-glutamate epimerase-like enolase superfamily enzyme